MSVGLSDASKKLSGDVSSGLLNKLMKLFPLLSLLLLNQFHHCLGFLVLLILLYDFVFHPLQWNYVLVLTSPSNTMPNALFGLDAGRIIDGGLNVSLVDLVNSGCVCEVSLSLSFCAGHSFSTSSLTWSSHDILLSVGDEPGISDSSMSSLTSVSGGPCNLVLGQLILCKNSAFLQFH